MKRRFDASVSAHAIQRFRERIMDLPEHQVANLLMHDSIRGAIERGAGRVTYGIVTVIAKEGAIVTVYPADWDTTPEGILRSKGRLKYRVPSKAGRRRASMNKPWG